MSWKRMEEKGKGEASREEKSTEEGRASPVSQTFPSFFLLPFLPSQLLPLDIPRLYILSGRTFVLVTAQDAFTSKTKCSL